MKLLCPCFLNTELERQEILHRKRKNVGGFWKMFTNNLYSDKNMELAI